MKHFKNVIVLIGIIFFGNMYAVLYANDLEVEYEYEQVILENGGYSIHDVMSKQEEPENEFMLLYYYEEDKLERYIAYQEQHQELSTEDIMWMVNIGLDNPFYTNINQITDTAQFPLLVNKYNELPDNYVPDNLQKLSSGHLLTSETKQAFERMCSDAKAEGYRISPASAYRSIEYQRNLYNRYLRGDSQKSVDTYSARAGHSEHNTGRAVDVKGRTGSINNFGQTPESGWVNENAHKYGFIVRYKKNATHITGYKYEPWHLTYVGEEVATDMKNKSIDTLEEYMVKFIFHQPNSSE